MSGERPPSPIGRGAGGEGSSEGAPSVRAYPPPELRDFARSLRRRLTDAERVMWRLLRNRQIAGAKFRRQHPVKPYILDFYCAEIRLAVELDGGQHAESSRDRARDAYLAEQGITVLRFWNNQVLRETEAALEVIYAAVCARLADQGGAGR